MSVFSRETDKKDFAEFLANEASRIYESLDTKCSGMFQSIDVYEREKGIFISSFRKVPFGAESFVFVLRKWNSFTPSLPSPSAEEPRISQHSVGGGYFFYIQSDLQDQLKPGYGLVVDPGYNFIHNFGLSGFSLDDIDGILITHAHNDHTNDFESLLSILFQRNSRHLNNRAPKTIDLFLNVGSFKKLSNYIDLASKNELNYIRNVQVLSPGDVFSIPNREDISCKLIALFTKHHEIITADYTIGLFLSVGDRSVLLTGDTGWDIETANKNDKLLKENGVIDGESIRVDVLICHIGTTKESEFKNPPSGDVFDRFYGKHLGVLGTISSIYHYKPDLCIVSEFGEELVGLRQYLIDEISITAKKIVPKCGCLPGDIGLGVFLDTKTTIDYSSNSLVPWKSIKYSDVKEDNGQRSIKYFTGEPVAKDIKMIGGIDIFREFYKVQIFAKPKLAGKDKYKLLRELSEFRFDVNDQDTSIQIVNDIFLALSCEQVGPLEVLKLLTAECDVRSIINFLKAYDFNTKFLQMFDNVVVNYGYGCKDEDKTLLDKILLSEALGNINQCIEHYLAGDDKQAEKALDTLRSLSVESVWPKLSSLQRVGLLLEYKDVRTSGFIGETASFAANCIVAFTDIVANHKSALEVLRVKYFGPDERCWKGGADVGVVEMEGAVGLLPAELQEPFLAEIAPLKAESDRIGSFDSQFLEIAKSLFEELVAIGKPLPGTGVGFHDLIHGLYTLHLLASQNLIDRKVLDGFHARYREVLTA